MAKKTKSTNLDLVEQEMGPLMELDPDLLDPDKIDGPDWYKAYVIKKRKELAEPFAAFTPRQRLFLISYAETGNLTVSARACGMDRKTPARWREKDELFAAAMDMCGESANDLKEEAMRQRGVIGFLAPVYFKGELCGYTRKFSDRLLELDLMASRPLKFRPNPPLSAITAGGNIKINFNIPRPVEDIDEYKNAVVDVEAKEVKKGKKKNPPKGVKTGLPEKPAGLLP